MQFFSIQLRAIFQHFSSTNEFNSLRPRVCVSRLTIIGSDNGFAPGRRRAIIWINAVLLLIGPIATNFSEILIEIHTFPFKKMHLKTSSGKRRPFCLSFNVLINTPCWFSISVLWYVCMSVLTLWSRLCVFVKRTGTLEANFPEFVTFKSLNIRCTLVGSDIVDHSDVVGALPVGTAPTTSSFTTQHLVSLDWAKTSRGWDEKHFSFGIWC